MVLTAVKVRLNKKNYSTTRVKYKEKPVRLVKPSSPWASCCVWCRTEGVSGCSPCCGSPAAGSFSGISAWLGPLERRWPELPPAGPSPLLGVLATRAPRPRGGAWCEWRPLPPPRPTWSNADSDMVSYMVISLQKLLLKRNQFILYSQTQCVWCSNTVCCPFGHTPPWTPASNSSSEYRILLSPGLAFADPAVHLCLLVVKLVVGVVPPPGSSCYHGSGLTRWVICGVFYKATHAQERISVSAFQVFTFKREHDLQFYTKFVFRVKLIVANDL